MPYQPQIRDAAHSLYRTAVLLAHGRTNWESGLDASPGSSGSAIQLDVDGGAVRIDGEREDIAGATLTLDATSSGDEWRADTIYASQSGGLSVQKGQSALPKPTVSGDPYPTGDTYPARQLFDPAPPDGSSFAGVPLYAVYIPDTATDSTDLATADIVDYRVEGVMPGTHDHPEFALNQHVERVRASNSQYVKLATINAGTGPAAMLRVRAWATNNRTNATPRALDVGIMTYNTANDVRAYQFGERNEASEIIVSRQDSGTAGTSADRYDLYWHAGPDSDAYIEMAASGDHFGGYERVEGLARSDTRGSIIYDTAPDQDGARNVPTYQSGSFVPLASYRFGVNLVTTTATSITKLTDGDQDVVVPGDQLSHSDYESDLFVSVQAGASNDTADQFTAVGLGTNGSFIDNSAASRVGTNVRAVSGPRQSFNPDGPLTINLFGYSESSSATAQIHRPSVTVWGRKR